MKKFNIILFFAIFAGFLSSCDLEINDDPNYPSSADNNMLLSSGIVYSAASIAGDLELIGGIWSQHYAQNQTSNQYKQLDGYYVSYTDYNRIWTNLFAGALNDLRILKNQSKATKANDYYSVSNLLIAYDLFILADVYGKIPFDEALRGDSGVFNPAFITSDEVHVKLIPLIDESITLLKDLKDKEANPIFAKYDIIFGSKNDSKSEFNQ